MPTADNFRAQLATVFADAMKVNLDYVDVRSRDLHKEVGSYPEPNNRMPICCDVMYAEMRTHDVMLSSPPKGKGASLVIRYRLPR